MATGKMMSGKYMSMSGLDLSFMRDEPKVDRVDGGPGEPGLVERLKEPKKGKKKRKEDYSDFLAQDAGYHKGGKHGR